MWRRLRCGRCPGGRRRCVDVAGAGILTASVVGVEIGVENWNWRRGREMKKVFLPPSRRRRRNGQPRVLSLEDWRSWPGCRLVASSSRMPCLLSCIENRRGRSVWRRLRRCLTRLCGLWGIRGFYYAGGEGLLGALACSGRRHSRRRFRQVVVLLPH